MAIAGLFAGIVVALFTGIASYLVFDFSLLFSLLVYSGAGAVTLLSFVLFGALMSSEAPDWSESDSKTVTG